MLNRQELLQIIERNARISTPELAVMLGADEAEVSEELERLHNEHVILGYAAVKKLFQG